MIEGIIPQLGLWFSGTLAAAVLGYFLNNFLERQSLPKLSRSRRKAISGAWTGKLRQESNEKREAADLTAKVTLRAGSRRVRGHMTISEQKYSFQFEIEGTFHYERYLQLEYKASKESDGAIDFGNMFLMLASVPNTMHGKLVGFGSISDTLIASDIMLTKEN